MTCPLGRWKCRSGDEEGEVGHYKISNSWIHSAQGLSDAKKKTELCGQYV